MRAVVAVVDGGSVLGQDRDIDRWYQLTLPVVIFPRPLSVDLKIVKVISQDWRCNKACHPGHGQVPDIRAVGQRPFSGKLLLQEDLLASTAAHLRRRSRDEKGQASPIKAKKNSGSNSFRAKNIIGELYFIEKVCQIVIYISAFFVIRRPGADTEF